jgi:hypothetical protein
MGNSFILNIERVSTCKDNHNNNALPQNRSEIELLVVLLSDLDQKEVSKQYKNTFLSFHFKNTFT